jgi:site-specific recombinase XerC
MLPHMVTQRDITAVIDAMEKAGRAPLTMKTHWSVIKAFFGWLFEEDVLTASPIAKASVSADAVLDRVRDIVAPDFRFIDMLSDRLGAGQDRLVFELLLGTGGRRSEVAGLMVGDVDIPEKDCQGPMIPSKVSLSAFESLALSQAAPGAPPTPPWVAGQERGASLSQRLTLNAQR